MRFIINKINKRVLYTYILVHIFVVLTGCTVNKSDTLPNVLEITKTPLPADFHRGKLKSLPIYNHNSNDDWQVDLRGYDLSDLNISNRYNDLIYATFDSKTIWPQNLPTSFNPKKIMELGKEPGLMIKKLHDNGLTGENIGIAIIDQSLLVSHIEYTDNLRFYEEINIPRNIAHLHGSATASIAVGKTVGIAPDADLYYIAKMHGEYKNGNFDCDFTWLAKSIDRILEINEVLPKNRKIRVISISVGWNKNQKGYDEVTNAVNKAKKEGIFVISSSLLETYGYFFNGLGRNPYNDPDYYSSYSQSLWWSEEYYGKLESLYNKKISEVLLVPMDSRCVASPTGNNDYVFYRTGGWSWSIPYLAGLYVLACQVDPKITPDKFWQTALTTGDSLIINNDDKEYTLEKILNPIELIESIKQQR